MNNLFVLTRRDGEVVALQGPFSLSVAMDVAAARNRGGGSGRWGAEGFARVVSEPEALAAGWGTRWVPQD
jgi:hypothetical protein